MIASCRRSARWSTPELNYTILQPSRYMQHLVAIWKTVLATGVHSMPFGTTARFSLVDLADLAEATARVMTEPGHEAATYQLAGPRPSARTIARNSYNACSAAQSARSGETDRGCSAAMPWLRECPPSGSRP